ncbi:MAG: VWA domain-containing protein [Bryobacteraceae bacterium]|nr:VWA domain-containing protein [Bryobacteraceae bacterium]
MHLLNRLLVVAAFFLASGAFITRLGAQVEDEPTFRTDTRLVVLHASVVDNKGRLVTNLPREAFKVYENGVQQQLKIFRREDVPVSMALVVDNSGSMRDKRRRVESAAMALVKASNRQDEVMVVNFNDDAFEDAPFTSDIKKMEEGLTRIDSRGGTAMRDAVSMTMDRVKEAAKKDKKVLLIVTDGNDNLSNISLERLVEKAHTSREILIYAIGLLNEEDRGEARKAKRALDALTKASGGLAYYPKEVDEVQAIAQQVAHDIRNQYVMAYTPSAQELDGSFRQIKVTVDGPNRPQVRTRTGYYAVPDSSKQRASAPSPAAF